MRLAPMLPLLALLLGGPQPTTAQDEKADAYLREQVAATGIPGLAAGVVRDGRVVFARGYGMANLEWSSPATPETAFEIASVSKPFTAIAVLMLVEEGKLSLGDRLVDRLPGLPDGWGDVTLKHLLEHTSGIKDYLSSPDHSRRRDYSDEGIVRLSATQPREFPAGTRWKYSNINYALLGMVVARASGQSYETFLTERILRPLGMEATRVNDTLAVVPRRAGGYSRRGGRLVIRDFVSPSIAATADGALLTTLLDLARFDAALNTEKLLKRPSLERMWTPGRLEDGQATGYGLGWFLSEVDGRRVVRHSGGTPGFRAHLARYRDDGLTVIVLANLDAVDVEPIARALAALYLPPREAK